MILGSDWRAWERGEEDGRERWRREEEREEGEEEGGEVEGGEGVRNGGGETAQIPR